MNFKKVEIFGFKSFADKLEIKFEDGITAIVGPNGCGKSNVADALRWVMGEQSPKSMRGASMSDLIFNGTEKRKSLSYCEVSLHFDNTNRLFNIDFNDIVLSRKLYRDGNSEYYLNRTPCRLKDIQGLLRDSGMGKGGYSIIGQGRIDEILSAKPEDRRSIFEEAAGVSSIRVDKNDSERRLQRTRDNLEKINAVLAELERQLAPLTKQAEVARKYFDLREKLRGLEINTYLYKSDSAFETKAVIQRKLDAISQELEIKEQESAKTNQEYEELREKFLNLDSILSNMHNQLTALSVNKEKIFGEINLYKERVSNIVADNERLQQESEKKQGKIEQTQSQINYSTDKVADKKEQFEQLSLSLQQTVVAYTKIVESLTLGEGAAEEHNLMLIDATNKLTEIKSNLSRLLAEKNALEETVASLQKRIEVIGERINEDTSKIEQSDKLIDLHSGQIDVLRKEAEHLTAQSQQASILNREAGEKLENINKEYNLKNARAGMLRSSLNHYVGTQDSVRKLLLDARENEYLSSKIEGVLSRLIRVPQKYESAIESVLGSALQNIVTPTDATAKELVLYLKQKNYGRATFQPLNTVKPRELDARFLPMLKREGCFGVAAQLISYDKKYDRVISSLLGSTVVVETIEDAIRLAKDTGYSFRIVTLDGDITTTQGTVSGGSRKGDRDNVLSHERELKELEDAIAHLVKQEKEQTQVRLENQNILRKSNERIAELSEKIHNADLILATEQEKRNKMFAGTEDARREIFVLEQERNTRQSRLSEILTDLNNMEMYENLINTERNTASESRQAQRQEFDSLRKSRDDMANEVTRLKIDAAACEAEIRTLESDIVRLSAELQQDYLELDLIAERIAQNTTAQQLLQDALQNVQQSLDFGGSDKAEELKKEIEELEQNKSSMNDRILLLDNERILLLNLLAKLNDDKTREENCLANVDRDIFDLQENIEEQYQLTYEMCEPFRVQNYDVAAGIAEAAKLRRQIYNLGDVNPNAIEDSKILGDRYYEECQNRDDLVKAEADLTRIIARLEKEMVAKFNTSFEQISANFVKVFRELFGGGNAQLILLDNENPLDAGIEIVAEPPGKRLQSISLLSGGERALTAIAILFSILKLKPMPFCVLDEIEAALDDANAGRFAKYLHRFSEDTQFIVITHRKPTMELSDNLYGVTMEEKGVSKIVSIKLTEAMSVAGLDK